MAPKIVIRSAPTSAAGWGPIDHFLAMARRLLEAETDDLDSRTFRMPRRLRRTLFPAARSGEDIVLYVVHHPGEISAVVTDPRFDKAASLRVLWIVDSFWSDRTPEALLHNFDLLVYMQKDEGAYYERVTGGRALFVGWGTDALDLGSAKADRTVDILRVGREPTAWEDDNRSAAAARQLGLRFQGRPETGISQAELMAHYADARYVIAFSNLAAPAFYTHPTKAYFTGRWTDALACGCVVAGIAPLQDTGIAEKLWDEACLELGSIDLIENLARIKEDAAGWSPDRARHNHYNALLRLDWRWGLTSLADRLGMRFPELDRDLDRLNDKAEKMRQAHWTG